MPICHGSWSESSFLPAALHSLGNSSFSFGLVGIARCLAPEDTEAAAVPRLCSGHQAAAGDCRQFSLPKAIQMWQQASLPEALDTSSPLLLSVGPPEVGVAVTGRAGLALSPLLFAL